MKEGGCPAATFSYGPSNGAGRTDGRTDSCSRTDGAIIAEVQLQRQNSSVNARGGRGGRGAGAASGKCQNSNLAYVICCTDVVIRFLVGMGPVY